MNIDILKPEIFPTTKIISGVTKRNIPAFGEIGLSFSLAGNLTGEELDHNLNFFAGYLKIPTSHLKFNQQVHGDVIEIVTQGYKPGTADGMISNEKGIVMFVKIADCCGILIYDPVNNAIAALHSGWKGTMQNIAAKGVLMMKENFGSKPGDLLVYLSPAASGEKYEIGWDVAKYFPDSVQQISNDKFLFDNRKGIAKQLSEMGVKPKNVEISDVCTISDIEYHSFRRDREKSGRMAAFIGMK